MGYAQGAYALGYVDDLRDPIEVLRSPPSGDTVDSSDSSSFGNLEGAQQRLRARSGSER
jgi:hypothetical protein